MISHGYPVKEHDDPIVDLVEAAVSGFSECLEPGAYLVDVIPPRKPRLLLRYIAGFVNYFFPFLLSFSLYEQCDMCLTGSPERDGKRKLSATQASWKTWRKYLTNLQRIRW